MVVAARIGKQFRNGLVELNYYLRTAQIGIMTVLYRRER